MILIYIHLIFNIINLAIIWYWPLIHLVFEISVQILCPLICRSYSYCVLGIHMVLMIYLSEDFYESCLTCIFIFLTVSFKDQKCLTLIVIIFCVMISVCVI